MTRTPRTKSRSQGTDEHILGRLSKLLDDDLHDEWSGSKEIQDQLRAPWKVVFHDATGDPMVRRRKAQELEDAGRMEDRIVSDSSGRYPIELLQNAQDACADAGVKGKAWFQVTDSALLVANQGIPFDAPRIGALLRLGASSKDPGDTEHHTVGYKGIGFTSVFEISDTPQIISKDVAFGFARKTALRRIKTLLGVSLDRVPARYFAFPLGPQTWQDDRTAIAQLLDDGAITVIRLPFGARVDRASIEQNLAENLSPCTLLLMPALNALEVVDAHQWSRRRGRKLAGGQVHQIRDQTRKSTSWFVARKRISVSPRLIRNLDSDLWASVHDLEVLVGFPWNKGSISPPTRAEAIHVYFPTEETTGRSVLLHGDFFLESSRRHIQKIGPGGEISQVAAAGLAELLASTVQELVRILPKAGPNLIQCLTPNEEAQGFGEVINEQLDDLLEDCPFLRTCSDHWVPPNKAELLGFELPRQRSQDFIAMLNDVTNLTDPAYEAAGREWLIELGAQTLDDETVVSRLEPHRCHSYDRSVLAIASWLNVSGWWKTHLLSDIRFLQCTDGLWRRPDELCRPTNGAPKLPSGLELATYRPPQSKEAKTFVEEKLNIDEMTLERSLDLVLDALRGKQYGRNHEQCQEVLRFMRAIYRRNRSLVQNKSVGIVRVPAHSVFQGLGVRWRRADRVYFSSDWVNHDNLETLYGPFSLNEFLNLTPPSVESKRRRDRRLLSDLGVADSPRWMPYGPDAFQRAWRQLPHVANAWICPDGHPQTPNRVHGKIIDRLDEILRDRSIPRARALVECLAHESNPFGTVAEIECTHSSHRHAVGRRKATGIQNWLLSTHEWVPVKGDPLERLFVTPGEAWTHVNSKAIHACVGHAQVSDNAARRFGLPQMVKPMAADLTKALTNLRRAYPELNAAPKDIRDGAFQLLRQLESRLRSDSDPQSAPPPCPVISGDTVEWTDNPIIPDLQIPAKLGLATLDPERPLWVKLPRAFEFQKVSEVVNTSTEYIGRRPVILKNLEPENLAILVALLYRKGADLRQVARRLGRLNVECAETIETTFRYQGTTATMSQLVHLRRHSGDDSATLVITKPTPQVIYEVAVELADWVSGDDVAEFIGSYLRDGTNYIRYLGLTDLEREEAAAAIERYLKEPTEPENNSDLGITGTKPPFTDKLDDSEGNEDSGAARGTPEPTAGQQPDIKRNLLTPHRPPTVGVQWIAGQSENSVFDTTNIVFRQTENVSKTELKGRKTTGAAGGTGPSGIRGLGSAAREEVETRAIQIAKRFAESLTGYRGVNDVQDQNKGWDLEILFDNEKWEPIEVKGFGGKAGSFIITRNELKASDRSDYRVFLITGVSLGRGQVIVLEHLAEWLKADDLKAMAWEVSNWDEFVASAEIWNLGNE